MIWCSQLGLPSWLVHITRNLHATCAVSQLRRRHGERRKPQRHPSLSPILQYYVGTKTRAGLKDECLFYIVRDRLPEAVSVDSYGNLCTPTKA